jgi:hypothetical protein
MNARRMPSLSHFIPLTVDTPLQPKSDREIFATTLDGAVQASDGTPANCGRAVHEAVAATHRRIEFEIHTIARRPAELDLRFAVTEDATVAVKIGSNIVHTFSAKAAGGPTLHCETFSLTQWTEGVRDVSIVVDFAFARDGIVYFFETGDCAAVLRQPLVLPYAVKSLSFFAASGLLLITASLIVAGLFKNGETTLRVFGIACTAGVVVYHLLGGAEIPKIAVRRHFRKWFASTRSRRTPVLIILWAATIPALWYALGILGTLVRRYQYNSAIEQARNEGNVRDAIVAFGQFPWRIEGQILIERYAYGLRAANNDRLREYLQTIVNDPSFEAAALLPKKTFQRDLSEGVGFTSDPALFYVSLLLESGVKDSRVRALRILSGRKDELSTVQRDLILLNMVRENPPEYDAVAKRIFNLLNHPQDAPSKGSFLFQSGWNVLGNYSVDKARYLTDLCVKRGCSEKETANIGEQLETAVTRFNLVLDRRDEALRSVRPVWLRPPDKLDLYAILHPPAEQDSERAIRAKSFADNYAYCYCIAKSMPSCDNEQLRKSLKVPESLNAPSKWLVNTVQDAELVDRIFPIMLDKGWRY